VIGDLEILKVMCFAFILTAITMCLTFVMYFLPAFVMIIFIPMWIFVIIKVCWWVVKKGIL
jgi:hypothetical protein